MCIHWIIVCPKLLGLSRVSLRSLRLTSSHSRSLKYLVLLIMIKQAGICRIMNCVRTAQPIDIFKMMIGQLCNLMRVPTNICSAVLRVADTSLVMQGRAPSILNNSAQYVLQILYNSENFEKIFSIQVELGPIISWRFALSKNFT